MNASEHPHDRGFLSGFRRDYYGGALIALIGSAALLQGLHYKIGTPTRMGAGFFPTAVGVVMIFLGILIALAAPANLADGSTRARTWSARGCACIIAGNIAFLVAGRYGGLVPATFLLVFIAGLGDRENDVKRSGLLALAVTIIAVVVFYWLLHLQFPLFRWGTT